MKTNLPNLKITSSQKALRESLNLESRWSKESALSQRILIYIASLLEELVSKTRPRRRKFPSAWNLHVKKVLKAGGTIQQAAREWKQRK